MNKTLKKTQTRRETQVKATQRSAFRKDIGIKLAWMLTLAGCIMLLFLFKRIESKTIGTPVKSRSAFDLELWFEGVYQHNEEQFLQNDWPVSKKLTLLKNQMDYKLYRKLNMSGYLLGKNNYLVVENNINSYLGKDYVGDSVIAKRFSIIKTVADSLKRRNIDLILIFAPNKEFFMPEVIPDEYLLAPGGKTNYEAYVAMCRKYNINHIDLKPFLHSLDKKYDYPLYPQLGTHLSYFAECMVADTVIKYMEHLKGMSLPDIFWDKIEYPAKPRMRDEDGIAKCGLLYPPKSISMAYPNIGFKGKPGDVLLKVLGIGDSYYRSFMYQGVSRYAFNLGEFWYYYNSVELETGKVAEVWEYDLKTKLEKNSAIIVYYCSAACGNFGSGFFEDAYQMYTAPAAYAATVKKQKPVRQNMKLIHENEDLLNEAIALSKRLNVSLDSSIRLKAIKMMEEDGRLTDK